ncbi:AGAP001045-PA [Anopheles gambiae str. PEST]|uniref:AGAP001045-PA n=1 Tax=Anopheles gambiae TaxID=7165 RepID=Q7PSX9_ANOGA|nr:AGAP001045-PA [Anopheles gambiae str. PEST]
MSNKIVNIVCQTSSENHPVILENYETYLEPRQHDMKCLLAYDPTISKVDDKVGNMLLVFGEKKLYIGQIHVPTDDTLESAPADLLRTYVARRNKETGKMRLYEVRATTLKHISLDRPAGDGQTTAELDLRQLLRLQSKFNARLGRRNLLLMNKRMDMSVMEEKLERTIAETVPKEPSATAASSEGTVTDLSSQSGNTMGDVLQSELLAKSKPDAKSLRDLYDAKQLIGLEVWQKLLEPARQLLQVPVEDLQMANAYLENKVKAAMQSSEPADQANLATVRICLYMDVLVRLLGPKAYQMAFKQEHLSVFTNVLDEPIRHSFLQSVRKETSTRFQVTKYTHIKALMYYLALAFAMEGQEALVVETLHRSLGVPRSQLLMYGRAVGARYNAKSDQFTLGTRQMSDKSEQLADMLAGHRRGVKRSRQN